MNYNTQDVADEFGITLQAVHISLKRSIPKLYRKFKNKYDTTTYETFVCLITGLGIQTEKDMSAFFRLLPKNVQCEIK